MTARPMPPVAPRTKRRIDVLDGVMARRRRSPAKRDGHDHSVRRSDMSAPPGVDLEEDVPDLVVRHRDEDGGGGATVLVGHDGRLPVERALAELRRGADPLPSDHLEQRRNLAPADDGPAYVADAAVTHRSRSRVGDQD